MSKSNCIKVPCKFNKLLWMGVCVCWCLCEEQLPLMRVRSPCGPNQYCCFGCRQGYRAIPTGIEWLLRGVHFGCSSRLVNHEKRTKNEPTSWGKSKKKKRRKKKKTNTHKINFYCIRISVSHDNGDDVLPFLSFSHCAKVFLFCSRTLGRFSFSSTFATCQRLILAAKVIYILACFHFPIETPTTIPNTAFHTTPHYRYSAEDPRRKLSQIAGSWQFDNKAVSWCCCSCQGMQLNSSKCIHNFPFDGCQTKWTLLLFLIQDTASNRYF